MAIVDHVTGDNIERFRGIIDFYMYAGKIPVARRWPKKLTPPYTALQAEAMAVFSIAASLEKRISANILLEWQKSSEGIRSQWTDTFKGLIMHFWKLNKSLPLIALDYHINETAIDYRIVWDTLQPFIDPLTPEILSTIGTQLILKSEIANMAETLYFTLTDDIGTRQVAPYILFEV